MLEVIPRKNIPLCLPSFLHSLATPTLLQYKTWACKLRFVCTQAVLQIAQAVRSHFSTSTLTACIWNILSFSTAHQWIIWAKKKQGTRLFSFLTFIFPRGEVAKVFSAQAKSFNKSVSGTEWGSASLMLKCLCELRKVCPF